MRAVFGLQRLLVLVLVVLVQPARLPLRLQALPDLGEFLLHQHLGRGERRHIRQRIQQLPLQAQPGELVVFRLDAAW